MKPHEHQRLDEIRERSKRDLLRSNEPITAAHIDRDWLIRLVDKLLEDEGMWIPHATPPLSRGRYLVYFDGKAFEPVSFAYYSSHGTWVDKREVYPSHWMVLPEPPKPDKA